MPTKAELKMLADAPKLKIRKGDRVVIIAGKDKGQEGFVSKVSPKDQKVIVLQDNAENPDQPLPLNAAIKHRKRRTEGERSARIKFAAPIHVSNVMLLDEKGKATRIGRRKEGDKIVRFAKTTKKVVADAPYKDA